MRHTNTLLLYPTLYPLNTGQQHQELDGVHASRGPCFALALQLFLLA